MSLLKRLSRSFYNRPTLTVAKELLGKRLVCGGKSGIITETEAYIGQDDPACHAAKGRTPRTEIMFGEAGYSYVYLIYGMYYCLNVVTEDKNFPAAVLIRSVQIPELSPPVDGPGKVCRYFEITKKHNALDITDSTSDLHIADVGIKCPSYETTSRIGISVGKEKLWRFVA